MNDGATWERGRAGYGRGDGWGGSHGCAELEMRGTKSASAGGWKLAGGGRGWPVGGSWAGSAGNGCPPDAGEFPAKAFRPSLLSLSFTSIQPSTVL